MTKYIQHFCANKSCNNIFLYNDVHNRSGVQRWKYCPECEAGRFPILTEDPNIEINKTIGQRLKAAKKEKK